MAIYVPNWLILTNISNAKANMAILAFEYRNWKKIETKISKRKKWSVFLRGRPAKILSGFRKGVALRPSSPFLNHFLRCESHLKALKWLKVIWKYLWKWPFYKIFDPVWPLCQHFYSKKWLYICPQLANFD